MVPADMGDCICWHLFRFWGDVMAQYDGSIRINTAIETKGLKRDIAALKGKMKELASGLGQGMAGVAGKINAVENSIKRLASGMRREVSGIKGSVDGLSGSFKRLGATVASVFAVRKAVGLAGSMTELGSDLEEVQNVVDVTFTTMSDKINEFAVNAAKSAGLSETMAKRYAGTFGAMSKSFGFTEDAAYQMSTALTQLSGDVASFYNITQDEAYTKLKSVFTGETETLKDLGVVMTENALNSYAMAKGIGKTVSKMTEQQEVALRYQFVLEKLSGASGDFIRTQDSWANQTRILKLQIESLKATIGQGLINVLNPLLQMLNTLLGKLKQVANAFKSFTESFFGKSSSGGSGAGNKYVDTAEGITGSLEDVSDAAQEAEKSLEGYLSPLDEINRYGTGKGDDLLPGFEDIDFGKLGDINMDVTITPDLDESALSKKIAAMAKKVKSVLERLFRPLKEAWDREGKSVMDSWKRALDEVWKLVKDIGRDFLDVWNQEKTIKILQNILGILSNVGRTVENLAHNFRKAWNENDRGKKILENIRDITGKIVENIKAASDKTVEWSEELDFAPLLESFEKYTKSLIPLADALSGVLADFYTKVLLPLGTWTIEKGLPELLDVLTKFNEKVDWESLRANLAEFWEHLEPFAETVGEGLILFIERVSDALADFLNSQEFKDFLVTVENWMDAVTPEDVADALELIAKSLITLKLALLGYSAIKGITGIFSTIKSFLAIFGIGGSAATAAATMDTVSTAATGLSTAMTGLAATAAVVGSYKLLTGHLEELFGAFGRSADQGKRLEERYEGLDGAARFAKDGVDTLKNGIEGYGFAADNCVGTGVALEKAMEDIGNGAILTDEHMAQLQSRFSLTDEDMEMLRQHMLDCNPLLREIADNLGFEDASPETLQDIAEGFSMIANGVEPLPDDLAGMTTEAGNFIQAVMDGSNPMDVYGEKLANIGAISDNTSESLNKTGRSISEGVTKGMEEADVETASQGLFGRIVGKIKELFGIHSPSTVMAEIGGYLIEGLKSGILGGWDSLKETVGTIATGITEKFKSILGIHSPSTVMDENGVYIMEGLENGIGGSVYGITEIFSHLSQSIVNIMTSLNQTIGGLSAEMGRTMSEQWKQMSATVQGTLKETYEMSSSVMKSMGETLASVMGKASQTWGSGWRQMGEITADICRNIESTVSGMVSSVRGMLSEISQTIESTKVAAASVSVGSSGQSYSAMPRAVSLARAIQTPSAPYVHPAFAKLSNIEIPKLATGAVLPANREFLALVGDQKHGTNVEAPLDTIRQASEEAVLNVLSKLGITGGLGNNSQTMVAKLYLDGHQVTEAVIKDGMVQQMATGNNPFLLGTI